MSVKRNFHSMIISLIISVFWLTADYRFYIQLRNKLSKSIKKFVTNPLPRHSQFQSVAIAEGILGNMPNLEELLRMKIDLEVHDILPFMAMNNPKLKTLEMRTLRSQDDIKFSFLSSLEIVKVPSMDIVLSFIKKHPTLQTLILGRIANNVLTNDGLIALINETNLKHSSLQAYMRR